MNKKLLTIAVGAALAVASGMASADVMWYGKADIKLVGGDTFFGQEGEGDFDFQGEGSRLGIRASEDVGNGLEVKFWHEWAINPADGTGPNSNDSAGSHVQFGHRDSLLSFHGSFGMIGLGSLAAPSKVIGAGKIDALFADTVGDLNGGNPAAAIGQPAGQQILYGNKVGDISFAIAYGVDNTGNGAPAGQDSDDSWLDANVQYSAGALYIGAGYHSAGDNYIGSYNAENLINLAVHYTMDNIKIHGGYQSASDVGGVDSGIDNTSYMLGASMGFGDNEVKAQYTTFDTDDDLGGTRTSVGFEHSLSKNVGVGVHWSGYSPDADGADDTSLYDLRTTITF